MIITVHGARDIREQSGLLSLISPLSRSVERLQMTATHAAYQLHSLLGPEVMAAFEQLLLVTALVIGGDRLTGVGQHGALSRFNAARRLLHRARNGRKPGLKDPQAGRNLYRLSRDLKREPSELLEEWLQSGMVIAASNLDEPQRVREGRVWLRADDDGVAAVPFRRAPHWQRT